MSDLEVETGEAASWFAENDPAASRGPRLQNLRQRRPRLHLVVGDSIARRANIGSRFKGDRIFCRANGGETWASLSKIMEHTLTAWQTAAAPEGLLPGNIIIWLTGNDVYSRRSLMSNFDAASLEEVGRTARSVIACFQQQADEVLVLGPLARLAGEATGITWEFTAAYHLERTIHKLECKCKFIPLGRALTRKVSKNRHGLKGCEDWYRPDGVHLPPAGYAKLADAGTFPIWLTLASD